MLARHHKFVLIALTGVLLFMASLLFALKSPVRVYDNRFRFAGFGLSLLARTNRVMYVQGRFVGHVQEHLAKLGLGIRPPLAVSFHTDKDDTPKTVIAVACSGELTERELRSVRGSLVNGDGKTFSLDSLEGPTIFPFISSRRDSRGRPYYFIIWFVDFNKPQRIATHNGTWILRLKSEAGVKLAEIPFRNPQK